MKKTFKKMVAFVVAITTLVVITTGMTVSAATQFTFNLGRGGSDCITMIKQNNMNYATVNITNGNLSNTHTAYVWVGNSSGIKITSKKAITGTGIYTFNFSTPIASGTSVKFCASGGYYDLYITGTVDV